MICACDHSSSSDGVPGYFVSLIRGPKHGCGRALIFIIRGLYRRPQVVICGRPLMYGRLHFEIFGAACARVKYITEAMAKSLSEFVPTFERLTHNPEDYLRYDSNV
jgi:hypothetical protein